MFPTSFFAGPINFEINLGALFGSTLIIAVVLVIVLSFIFKYINKPTSWSNMTWIIVFSLFSLILSTIAFVFGFPFVLELLG